jgi:deoxyribose-phosphate aldolase
MTAGSDLAAAARVALACLDLTSLNDADTADDVERLCRRAVGAPGRGTVAAVCVWPRFAAQARARLPASVRVAAVANFPDGGTDLRRAVRDAEAIVAAGAQEIDVVLPHRDLAAAPALLAAVRRACAGLTLKVILETGVLAAAAAGEDTIRRACRIALDEGADFLKTSTGKAGVGATPAAARLLLEAIAGDAAACHRVGFKAAGGVRSVADAALYQDLAAEILGPAALVPQRLRIGASALLEDIEAVLAGRAGGPPAGAAASY